MLTIQKVERIEGRISVPGDKSISHRAVMLLGISRGSGKIDGFLPGEDCLGTIRCLRQLGVEIEQHDSVVVVHGRGRRGLTKPEGVLDVGNSGTTMRLMAGILAGQDFACTVTGDASLLTRPMDRIAVPLRLMGADIGGTGDNDSPPLRIQGKSLKAIDYILPVASAQVKSAILLAGLYADGETTVRETVPARNHTECMLEYLGAQISMSDGQTTVRKSDLEARDIHVPGDISSAAFFIAAAAALPGSHLIIENVGLNPTRTGIIDVLRDMGADIAIENLVLDHGEARGDLIVRGKALHGTTVSSEMIPRLIDEIPVLAVIAGLAEGQTRILGAGELRVKESNRIASLVSELSKLGMTIREVRAGLEREGPRCVRGAVVESYGDHRMAMALAVAGLFAQETVKVRDSRCINVSFPGFEHVLQSIVN